MALGDVPERYDRSRIQQIISTVDRELSRRQVAGLDYEVGPGAKIVLTAPNGSRWALTVSNAGALVVTAA